MRHERFTCVVVPLDEGMSSERATLVALSLARRGGLDVEVVEVLPPGTDVDRAGDDLRHRAQHRQLPTCHARVLLGHDAGPVLAEYVRTRPGALVVIATAARGPLGELRAARDALDPEGSGPRRCPGAAPSLRGTRDSHRPRARTSGRRTAP